jgi:peptidyl-prolyl cis-trans isomerase SurA
VNVEALVRGCRTALVTLILAAAATVLPAASHAQQVFALVNGQPITVLDIEHRSKFLQLSSKKVPSRREVLDSLVDEILEVNEAKRFGIEISDADVDAQYKGVASRMGLDSEKLTQLLVNGGASADTLKHRLRAQLVWTNLVRGRYKASLEVAEKDVDAQLQQKPEATNVAGFEYIMRPVVFIVPRGSPDAAYEARKHEAEALRGRFVDCTDGVVFARALPDVAVRDQVSKYSADLAQELRQILDGTAIGHLTPPEQTAEGIQMFAVCAKKETKSETPLQREVRDQMFQQKFGAQAKRYLDSLRRQAMIEYKMPEGK